jgi:hypothetical protein
LKLNGVPYLSLPQENGVAKLSNGLEVSYGDNVGLYFNTPFWKHEDPPLFVTIESSHLKIVNPTQEISFAFNANRDDIVVPLWQKTNTDYNYFRLEYEGKVLEDTSMLIAKNAFYPNGAVIAGLSGEPEWRNAQSLIISADMAGFNGLPTSGILKIHYDII